MKPIYSQTFSVLSSDTDRFARLKPSHLLAFLQESAGNHSVLLGTGREELALKNLFWAVLRHRVQITRLPTSGETITVETWPMPTTRTAYPRSSVAYDAQGQELFRAISLWVLMDSQQRALVLPDKSGVQVDGLLRGNELTVPGTFPLKSRQNQCVRTVRYTDTDCNGHMNNCRYLDWMEDVLPGNFHQCHSLREFSVRYLSEAREGENLCLSWELSPEGLLRLDAGRQEDNGEKNQSHIFGIQAQY